MWKAVGETDWRFEHFGKWLRWPVQIQTDERYFRFVDRAGYAGSTGELTACGPPEDVLRG